MTTVLNHSEKYAVQSVVSFGKQFGFGNLIHRLNMAWVLHYYEDCRNFYDDDITCFEAGVLLTSLSSDEKENLKEVASKDFNKTLKEIKEYVGDE